MIVQFIQITLIRPSIVTRCVSMHASVPQLLYRGLAAIESKVTFWRIRRTEQQYTYGSLGFCGALYSRTLLTTNLQSTVPVRRCRPKLTASLSPAPASQCHANPVLRTPLRLSVKHTGCCSTGTCTAGQAHSVASRLTAFRRPYQQWWRAINKVNMVNLIIAECYPLAE